AEPVGAGAAALAAFLALGVEPADRPGGLRLAVLPELLGVLKDPRRHEARSFPGMEEGVAATPSIHTGAASRSCSGSCQRVLRPRLGYQPLPGVEVCVSPSAEPDRAAPGDDVNRNAVRLPLRFQEEEARLADLGLESLNVVHRS